MSKWIEKMYYKIIPYPFDIFICKSLISKTAVKFLLPVFIRESDCDNALCQAPTSQQRLKDLDMFADFVSV